MEDADRERAEREARIERQQIEQVFGLTGGELDDEPLVFRAPGHITGCMQNFEWAYHYDGVPEWAASDFPDQYDSLVDYFTLVEIGCSYGSGAPEWLLFDKRRYKRVAQYANSGETECPCGSSGCNEKVGQGCTEGMDRCPLCEADKGEDHGYIYVGDGCESVYLHVDISCAECGCMAEEMTDDDPLCACAPTFLVLVRNGSGTVFRGTNEEKARALYDERARVGVVVDLWCDDDLIASTEEK